MILFLPILILVLRLNWKILKRKIIIKKNTHIINLNENYNGGKTNFHICEFVIKYTTDIFNLN